MEQLKQLKQMFDEGFLTKEEYDTRRSKLIDKLTGTSTSQEESVASPLMIDMPPIAMSPEKSASPIVHSLQETQTTEVTLEHKLFIVNHLSKLSRETHRKVLALLQNNSPENLVEGMKQQFIKI